MLVAVGMVAALYLVRGSPAEQSEEAVGVFLAALDQGDGETAHALLCAEVRDRIGRRRGARGVPTARRAGTGRRVGGDRGRRHVVVEVEVRGADGATTSFVVVNEDGAHVCGTSSAG